MNPDRWQRIDALLSAALDCAEEERGSFLARACEGDEELRTQVERLLSAHREAGSFLEESPPAPATIIAGPPPTINESDKTRISLDPNPPRSAEEHGFEPRQVLGRYIVLNKLGGGGMGVVYAAYDPELDRKLALKLLHAQVAENLTVQGAQARLLREAQAMARLSHPNVIAVHDVGAFGERVFIAMEFVDGRTVTRWLKEKTRTTREILEVFVQAGKGLAAAHAAGLVHRDFKPDNVLVGFDGWVKVLDFGLARAAEDLANQAPTLPAQLAVGGSSTPRALEAQLTKTGVFLGTPAYMGPEQLSGKATDARTDQFSFCVALYEALYGERPFAGDTWEDIISAVSSDKVRPPPQNSRVPSWLRTALLQGLAADPAKRHPNMDALLAALARDPAMARKRWAVAAGVVLLALAAGGGLVSLRERSMLLCRGGAAKLVGVWDESRQADVQRAFLHTSLPYAADAWEGAKRALDKYVAGWLAMYQDACEATHRRGEQSAQLLDLRMLCLERRRQELRALADLFAAADGKVVENAVQAAQAQTPLSTCADFAVLTARTRLPEDPVVKKRVEELHADLARVKALTDAGKHNDAIPPAEKALEVARRIGDSAILAEALLALASPLGQLRQSKRAEGLLEEAVQASMRSHSDEALASALVALIRVVGTDQLRIQEGHRWSRYAEAAIAALGPGHEALEAKRVCNLSLVVYEQAQYKEAAHYAEHCVALAERAFGRSDPAIATAVMALAVSHERLGEFAKAAEEAGRAAADLEDSLGPKHPQLALLLEAEGVARFEMKDSESLRLLQRARAIREAAVGSQSPPTAFDIGNTGAALVRLGRPNEALEYFQQALEIFQRTVGPDSWPTAWMLYWIGEVHLRRGELKTALSYASRALIVVTKLFGSQHVDLAYPLLTEGQARLVGGAPSAAIPPLERSLALRESTAVAPCRKAESAFTLARALVAAGRSRSRALDLARRSADLFRQQGRGYEGELREVERWLAERSPSALRTP